jgi:hypothetical protein
MDTPAKINNKPWSWGEDQMLEELLQYIVEQEDKDPDVEPKNRDETFKWLSSQFSSRGFTRSSKAIERRAGGRLLFPRSPKNTTQSHNRSQSLQSTVAGISSRLSMLSDTSLEEDVPLSQLQGWGANLQRDSTTVSGLFALKFSFLRNLGMTG